MWEDYLNGERLRLGARTLAIVTRLDDDRCRVNTNPDSIRTHDAFFASYATGHRYVETWARKWEAEIRADGPAALTLYGGQPMRTPTTPVPTPPRRRKRSR